MNKKQNIFLEFTTTNNCNCRCKYCFEQPKGSTFECRNLEEEARQLKLLQKTLENFDSNVYEWLTISFWGGEPFLNLEYMKQLIEISYKYPFVRYHIYSNGTLLEKYREFLNCDFISSIKSRLRIQLSYDGEPHHTIMRGDNSKNIFIIADMLREHEIFFSFKATLSFELLDKLPEIWMSYKNLYDKYGNSAIYHPTLDTTYTKDDKLEEWTVALLKIAKLEYQFIRTHGRPLWDWFIPHDTKSNCMLGNSIHVHNSGKIYICHGCAYIKDNSNLEIGNTKEILSYLDVVSDKYNLKLLPAECVKCPATYCSVCHVAELDKSKDPYSQWISCKTNNKNRCKYFKIFGFISKLMKFSSIVNK